MQRLREGRNAANVHNNMCGMFIEHVEYARSHDVRTADVIRNLLDGFQFCDGNNADELYAISVVYLSFEYSRFMKQMCLHTIDVQKWHIFAIEHHSAKSSYVFCSAVPTILQRFRLPVHHMRVKCCATPHCRLLQRRQDIDSTDINSNGYTHTHEHDPTQSHTQTYIV